MDNKIKIIVFPSSESKGEGVCIITDFHNLIPCQGLRYKDSPPFFTGQNNEYKWILDIFLEGYDSEYSKYVSIRFFLENGHTVNSDELSGVCFIVSIIDKDGKMFLKKSAVFKTSEDEDSAILKDFVLKEDILKNSKILRNGELNISFKIATAAPHGGEEISTSEKNQLKIFGQLLVAEKYTDFKLVVHGKEFNVHRAILTARSPVFEAMFDTQMRESDEGKVEIVDVEEEVMEKLLRFVYVGKVENFEGIADKLLIAADKYQIDELKQLCENFIFEQLNLINIYDTLRLADANSAEILKNKTVQFFYRNAKELLADIHFKDKFKTLPANLMTDIVCELMDKL